MITGGAPGGAPAEANAVRREGEAMPHTGQQRPGRRLAGNLAAGGPGWRVSVL